MATDHKNTALQLEDISSENRDGNTVLGGVSPEHEYTIREAFIIFRPAICWCFLFSLGVVSAGFDPQLVGTLVAIPQFQRDFGQPFEDGYVVPASWQSAFNLGVPVGQVVGAYAIGYPLERYGRRKTLAMCCVVSCIVIAIQASAQAKGQILVAELINGVILGGFPVIAPAYISETTPVCLRGIGAAFINLSFVIGQLIASGVLAGTQSRSDRWSYDIPFLVQLIWPIVILALLPFAPESPWWLVRRGQNEKALKALAKLCPRADTRAILAHIEATTKLEYEQGSEDVGFTECFKRTDLRRTIISSMVYATQPLAANFFVIGYAVYFFEIAGLPSPAAFNLGVGVLAAGFIATLLSWPLIARFGRRTIFNSGLYLLTLIVLLIGILDVVPYTSAVSWAQSSLMVVYNWFYDLTIGPLCFVIICEISSARLRGKTIAVATAVNALVNLVCAVGIPYALNENEGNLRGKLAFIFLGSALPCCVYCHFCLPESKGRTFEELDIMFEQRFPTRDFKHWTLDRAELAGHRHANKEDFDV